MDAPIDAKTIQIFLPTGEPRGIRIAEITTRIVQAIAIPRSDLAKAKHRPEMQHVALYFLFGESDAAARPSVYIGQTEDLVGRLGNHDQKKEFWQTAVLIVSKTHSFTQAHIRFLEWHCIQMAKEADRYNVENGNGGSKPHVTEPMEADLRDAFQTLSVLVGTLGFPVFEPISRSAAASQDFFLRGKDAEAVGELVEDGFVVRAGSLGRNDIVPSAIDQVTSIRQPLFESGVIVHETSRLRFSRDHLFRTPSGAAMAVLGRSANGWMEWKNTAGETLHESRRVQDPDISTRDD
ncbi:MAG: GIY-YIG nuclease family protein [Gemmataceae bacterium]